MLKIKQCFLLLPSILGIAALCYVTSMTSVGKVVAVKDDNTIVVRDTFGKERTLRLEATAAAASGATLATGLLDKQVQYDWVGLDKDKTVLATVTVNAEPAVEVTDFAWLPELDTSEADPPAPASPTTVAATASAAALHPQW